MATIGPRTKDCSALLYPSATLDDLSQKISSHAGSGISCDVLMTRRPLLEPGILTTYINTEQDALVATTRSSDPSAWWRKNGSRIKTRWNFELTLSTDSIFQQSIMIGDLTLPQLAQSVDSANGHRFPTTALGEKWQSDHPCRERG
jgi:hypothetical protein